MKETKTSYKQICCWLPVEIYTWLKSNGGIRPTIIYLVQREIDKQCK